MGEAVWFIGPWQRPGYFLRLSTEPGCSERAPRVTAEDVYRPHGFPWRSMDRKWKAVHGAQGMTSVEYAEGWSVLSVADYTVDPRPGGHVTLAVQRADVPEAEMRKLAQERYPSVWARLQTESPAAPTGVGEGEEP